MASLQRTPSCEPIQAASFDLSGEIGRRLGAVTTNWILPTPHANPIMLEMFRHRDRQPWQDQVPWAGEFAGKYLTHAVQVYRLRRDAKLHDHIDWFVGHFTALQAEDGYLGPWPKPYRLRGLCELLEPWDAWGHYHAMIGLMLWYEQTDDRRALARAERIGDLFCNRFLGDKPEKLHDTGAHEMNQAPAHSLALLYRHTGRREHLDMALQIEREFEMPPAGDYLRTALAGKPFHETPKPRWESLHPIMGLAELYYLTGDERRRDAFEHLWWSMLEGDRHNNGGFTSGERACGDPYHTGPIETCCTVAWMVMSVEMLKLTASNIVADELELSLFNSGIGMMSPSGRWVTYNTPMAGRKTASPNDHTAFQLCPGGAELNCCSVNGPRALGSTCEWAIMQRQGALLLNYYGPGTITAPLDSGNTVTLRQETDYPRGGNVRLTVSPETAERFTLALRIPYWSKHTRVTVNDEDIESVAAGGYLELDRQWTGGDVVNIEFDYSLHFWVQPGEGIGSDAVRRASIYRGPILLTFDPRFNDIDLSDPPVLDANAMDHRLVESDTWLAPWLLCAFQADKRIVRLCDFGSAGVAGHHYESWLPVRFGRIAPAEFSRHNPLRSFRLD